MDESTLVRMLSHAARQILDEHDGPRGIEQPDECAERLAEATWDGLIVLLRGAFERGETVVLDGLGSFVREGERWSFMPASALARAGALGAGAEGQARLTGLALFYLDQAAAILERVPEDAEVRTERGQSPVLRELAGPEAGQTSRLSNVIRLVSVHLLRVADRLSPGARAVPERMKVEFRTGPDWASTRNATEYVSPIDFGIVDLGEPRTDPTSDIARTAERYLAQIVKAGSPRGATKRPGPVRGAAKKKADEPEEPNRVKP